MIASPEIAKLTIVCATSKPAHMFNRATLLGRSLQAFPLALRPKLYLYANNHGQAARGLSSIYNQAIAEISDSENIAFIHDDVYIHAWNLVENINTALKTYDIIGVAGSSGVGSDQPGWLHDISEDGSIIMVSGLRLSGSVNHCDHVNVRPDYFGVAPAPCELLDGLFLATKHATLTSNNLGFDERFKFHCYDTDFCHSALAKGLKLGTWHIGLTHESTGNFGSDWIASARQLKEKLLQRKADK